MRSIGRTSPDGDLQAGRWLRGSALILRLLMRGGHAYAIRLRPGKGARSPRVRWPFAGEYREHLRWRGDRNGCRPGRRYVRHARGSLPGGDHRFSCPPPPARAYGPALLFPGRGLDLARACPRADVPGGGRAIPPVLADARHGIKGSHRNRLAWCRPRDRRRCPQ